jgi:methylphosphotriester-DNA--protein-cysteine methyltransferase
MHHRRPAPQPHLSSRRPRPSAHGTWRGSSSPKPVTPTALVDRTRLEAACAILTVPRSLEEVADRTGVGSVVPRRLFQRELGVTPGAYRKRFKTTAR